MASRAVVFPAWANVSDATPLLLLAAASPLNAAAVDIVVATPSACAAIASFGAAPLCDSTRRYVIGGALYYYRDTAANLGMVAAPNDVCGI
jgi:hypothetical protein